MNAQFLVVDDSGLTRRILRQYLEEMGHAVEEASDGPQAIERYALNHHDVIILDMVMHGMYGLEVLAKFKELDPAVKVIVVTADIQKSTREHVITAGAAALVNKPLKKEEFAAVVQKVMKGENAWN